MHLPEAVKMRNMSMNCRTSPAVLYPAWLEQRECFAFHLNCKGISGFCPSFPSP